MSSDIQPGDVVVCVDARPHPSFGGSGLREGCHYRVTAVGGAGWSDAFPDRRSPGLKIAGVQSGSPNGYFSGRRFRKLNDEPDNAELIERIRACKPVKVLAAQSTRQTMREIAA